MKTAETKCNGASLALLTGAVETRNVTRTGNETRDLERERLAERRPPYGRWGTPRRKPLGLP